MRKKSNLSQKLELFYKEIQPKSAKGERMRLQTDQEFQQNEIKKLNLKYDVDMFSSRIRGGKAFAAEQKIREFKKILFKSKKLHKVTNNRKRLDSKKLIKKAVENMNKTNSQKYGLPPESIEQKTLSDNVFREIYDFHRLVRVSKDADRYKRHDVRHDKKLISRRKQLREPSNEGEKVLVLAERLKKKDAPGALFKSTTENIPFFNRNEIFIVRKVLPVDDHFSYNYWLSKRGDDKIIDKRFLRQELFALKNQFER